MRLEQSLVQIPELSIEFLPFSKLQKYIASFFNISTDERHREEIVSAVREVVYKLGSCRNIPKNIEEIRRMFIQIYCSLNFIAPEFNLTYELAETREQFLNRMARSPFYMERKGAPIALELYHQPKDKFEQDMPDERDIIIAEISRCKVESAYKMQNFVISKIVESARCALSQMQEQEKESMLEAQLKLLVSGIVTPRMFGVELVRYNLQSIPQIYLSVCNKNGDFKMPLPSFKN
jgi:hypothetical protein